MILKRLADIPIRVLWPYREFKRDEVPAPRIPFINMYNIEEVKEHIRIHGIIPLELSIIKHSALLTDGNHRIVAAKELGFETVPVEITVHFGSGVDIFYEHTLTRFKSIDPVLEHWLRRLFFK